MTAVRSTDPRSYNGGVTKQRRLALIKLVAESADRYEEGSLTRDPTTEERAEQDRLAADAGSRAGSLWVARHRGLTTP